LTHRNELSDTQVPWSLMLYNLYYVLTCQTAGHLLCVSVFALMVYYNTVLQ